MVSPYKALQIWVKRFSKYLAYERLHRPDSWQGFLYNYLSSFISQILNFLYLKRFPFLFLLSHVSEKRELNSYRNYLFLEVSSAESVYHPSSPRT